MSIKERIYIGDLGSTIDKKSLKVYKGGKRYNEWEFIWNPLEDQAAAMQQGLNPQTGQPGQPGQGIGGAAGSIFGNIGGNSGGIGGNGTSGTGPNGSTGSGTGTAPTTSPNPGQNPSSPQQ